MRGTEFRSAGPGKMKLTISAAMTLDGKIATAAGDSKISSTEDLVRVHRMRARSDAIVVGISTILSDDPLLTVRHIKGPNPARIIVDSRARIPPGSQILRTARKVRTIVAVTGQAPEQNRQKIKEAGAEVLITGEGTLQTAAVPQGVDLLDLFSQLEKKMGF